MIQRMLLNETSYFGPGAIEKIPDEVREHCWQKALIVTDRDLIRLGVAARVTHILDENKIKYSLFDDIHQNPSIENVQHGVQTYHFVKADCMIAIGGGSVMDTAKAIGIIANNPDYDDVLSLEGRPLTLNQAVPIVAVPTTAGTAAEVTTSYTITDVKNRRKIVCNDPHNIPVVAIVDPDMMAGMPKGLTVATGMDALTHAIEGYISKGAWPMSDIFTLKAVELIGRSLRKAALENDPEARSSMALGQHLAGMGYSNAGRGVVHSLAHAVGGVYGTSHGLTNGVILPWAMEFNAECTGEKYRDIAKAMGVHGTANMSPEEYRRAAVDAVRQLGADLGVPANLGALGVKAEDVPFLAQQAMSDVCTADNPREASQAELEELLKAML